MKINNLNLTLEWETIRNIPELENFNVNVDFPSYNINVKNKNNTIIKNYIGLKEYEPITEYRIENLEFAKKTKFFSNISTSRAKNIFKYNFYDNYSHYKKINNKIGFYKEIIFDVDYNNDGKGDFELNAEYSELDNLNKNSLFKKIYRSNDYINIKILTNKKYFEEKQIFSFLILSDISNRFIKEKKLSNLFIENVKEKALDINGDDILLTIPFKEIDLVEISENLNIRIIPLNYFQSELYKFLLEQNEKEDDINNFYKEFFSNQYFDIGKIYKQVSNNETLIYYQNYIYLFNKDSLNTNCLNTDLNINSITFNKYFPLLNKNQDNKTICLSDDLNTDTVQDNSYNFNKDYLGYYAKNMTDYEDIIMDIDYLQNQGVRDVKIIDIEEIDNICNIYIEFITLYYNNEKFYIDASSNLKFQEKYKTLIDNKEYITFLFKYSYNLNSLNEYLSENLNINKNQIISEKDLINFSAKLIL